MSLGSRAQAILPPDREQISPRLLVECLHRKSQVSERVPLHRPDGEKVLVPSAMQPAQLASNEVGVVRPVAGSVEFLACVGVESERSEQAGQVQGRARIRCGLRSELAWRRQRSRDPLRDCGTGYVEFSSRQEAVVMVRKRFDDRPIEALGFLPPTVFFIQARQPIQCRRSRRRSGKAGDMLAEQFATLGRIVKPRPPANLPMRVWRMLTLRKSLRETPEPFRILLAVVLQVIVIPDCEQRFLVPFGFLVTFRELGHARAHLLHQPLAAFQGTQQIQALRV